MSSPPPPGTCTVFDAVGTMCGQRAAVKVTVMCEHEHRRVGVVCAMHADNAAQQACVPCWFSIRPHTCALKVTARHDVVTVGE